MPQGGTEQLLIVYQNWTVQDNPEPSPERPLTVVDQGGTVQDYPEQPPTVYQYWAVQDNTIIIRPLTVYQDGVRYNITLNDHALWTKAKRYKMTLN